MRFSFDVQENVPCLFLSYEQNGPKILWDFSELAEEVRPKRHTPIVRAERSYRADGTFCDSDGDFDVIAIAGVPKEQYLVERDVKKVIDIWLQCTAPHVELDPDSAVYAQLELIFQSRGNSNWNVGELRRVKNLDVLTPPDIPARDKAAFRTIDLLDENGDFLI